MSQSALLNNNFWYDTNELIYETETDSDIENKLMVTREEGGEGIN